MDLDAHYKQCAELVAAESRYELLQGLYLTFKVDQGPETDNLRKATLAELDKRGMFPRSRDDIFEHPIRPNS